MLGNLIGGFITIVVGVNLIPAVASGVKSARYYHGNTSIPTNITGASATILDLTVLFFALGVTAAGIAIAAEGLRSAGLLGM
jgi:hypothetical protein